MEDLASSLSRNIVPGRLPWNIYSWERFAWPSKKKSLNLWFTDLLRRVEQLNRWTVKFITPISIWLSGLFNPMAFLTAIMQVSARTTGIPLDKMTIETYVTNKNGPDEVISYPSDGMYVHGLFMEGAQWESIKENTMEVDNNNNNNNTMNNNTTNENIHVGHIEEGILKKLLAPMPLLHLRAVPIQNHWLPSSVGYLRQV